MTDEDRETRQRLLGLEAHVGELGRDLLELATVVWGDDRTRDNGLRSRVVACEEYQEQAIDSRRALEAKLNHFLDNRKNECYGLAALKEREGEDTEVRVANVQGKWQAIVGIMGPLAMFLVFILDKVLPPIAK